MFSRIHLIVMDSVGIGEAPDASKFDDSGSHTLGHISSQTKLQLPNLASLGLGAIEDLESVPTDNHKKGYATKLQEYSASKDTMTGHWELMGLRINHPFKVCPNGFPEELLAKISDFSGRKILCNKPYSGTDVIDDYGEEQLETGALIVYTSADPVLQIAVNEEIIPLEELYRICEYTREITKEEPYTIGRIIARPFVGTPGHFTRTSNRHDYALNPFGKTDLDSLKENSFDVIAIGKINDIFNGQGITQSIRTTSNMDGVDKLIDIIKKPFNGLSFTNLVDFDALYGHRRDVEGYAKALIDFDERIPEIIESMTDTDLLLITADHGNDPTFRGTDHTREFVPLLAYSKIMKSSGVLPIGAFSDVGATIADNFNVPQTENGNSFLDNLK